MPRCPECGERAVRQPRCPHHHVIGVVPVVALPSPSFRGYRPEGILGSGGFGTVYAATREADGARVAIKVASAADSAIERLQIEALALAAIGPPSVPRFFELGTSDAGETYLVMERVVAPTLAELMSGAPLGVPGALRVLLRILGALEIAHARGYAHRDLKPENIFVEEEQVRLIDFGLVKRVDVAAPPGLTKSDALIGTAEYMAPEQCGLGGLVDARADLYALGVVLFELVVGRPPFWGNSADVHRGHRGLRPPRIADSVPIPAELEAAVQKCLAKDPEQRFQTAAELRASLASILACLAAPEAPTPSADPARAPADKLPVRPQRLRRTMAILVASAHDLGRLGEVLAAHGGVVAHVAAGKVACVFDVDAGANPARRALAAASSLVASGIWSSALVDLGAVAVEERPGGARCYVSKSFEPASMDTGPGVHVGAAAQAVLGAPARPGESPAPVRVIGRNLVLTRLTELADAVPGAPAPTMVAVIGDAGHGKSHLRAALAAELRQRMHVLDLESHDPGDGDSEHTLRALIRAAFDADESPPADAGHALVAARLGHELGALLWPAIAMAMQWIGPERPELERRPIGQPGDRARLVGDLQRTAVAPGALRSQVVRGVGEALRRRAAQGPLAILLDDAHLADETTLDALEYSALSEGGAPIFVCAFARPRFTDTRATWGERAAVHERVDLAPLDRASAELLCRELLAPAEDVPARAVDLILARSQQVPLLLVELVRALKRDGLVRPRERGGGWYLVAEQLHKIPDLPMVDWLTQRELELLPTELAAHARLVSLLGLEISTADVDGVVRGLAGDANEFPLDAGVGLRRLADAGLLVGQGPHRFRFRHALVRDAVACTTPPRLARAVHRAAWAYYRDLADLPAEVRLLSVAFHAAHAGLDDEAAAAYFEVAERTRARHAYFDAEVAYGRCIDHLRPGARLAEGAFHGRGRMRYRLSRYDGALADLKRARELTRERGDLATEVAILLDEATALDWMGDFVSSEARARDAAALHRAQAASAHDAEVLLGLGRSHHRFSRDGEACELLALAAASAELQGDAGYETFVIASLLLGWILPGLGRLDEASEVLDRVVARCRALDDRLHLAAALNNRAPSRGFKGDTAGMLQDLRSVVDLAREVGQPTMELIAEFNLGEQLLLLGDFAAADPHVERALALERRLTGEWGRPKAVVLEARLRIAEGDIERARSIVARIHAQQAEVRAQGRADGVLVPSDEVLCAAVELATRAASAEAWLEVDARSTRFSVEQDRLEILIIGAQAARRAGDLDEARRRLETAQALSRTMPNVMQTRVVRELSELA